MKHYILGSMVLVDKNINLKEANMSSLMNLDAIIIAKMDLYYTLA